MGILLHWCTPPTDYGAVPDLYTDTPKPTVYTVLDDHIYKFISTTAITLANSAAHIPDIILSMQYDMLNKTSVKLTALNTWLYRNNLSSQDMFKLATIATLENIPSTSKASLVYTLEKRLTKNITYNLGMDSPEHEDNELEGEIGEREERTFPSRTSSLSSDRAPAAFGATHERSTRSSNEKQRVEKSELSDLRKRQPVRRDNGEAHTAVELELLQQRLPTTTLAELESVQQGTPLGEELLRS